jgi:glycosyltransferase involved in cell wall biosynthesis
MQSSLITIGVPTFNRANLWKTRLLWNSLIGQTDQNFEIIIVDDFSKDDSVQSILNLIKNSSPNIRIRLYRLNPYKKLQTQASGIPNNILFKEARGSVFIHLDDDGFVHPELVSFVRKNISPLSCLYGEIVFLEKGTFRAEKPDSRAVGMKISLQPGIHKLGDKTRPWWGAMWATETHALRVIGGHDTKTAQHRGSDYRLGIRLAQIADSYLVTFPEMKFFHIGLSMFGELRKRGLSRTQIDLARNAVVDITSLNCGDVIRNGGMAFWKNGELDDKYELVYSNLDQFPEVEQSEYEKGVIELFNQKVKIFMPPEEKKEVDIPKVSAEERKSVLPLPTITIGIPTYNRASLWRTGLLLGSLRDQTDKDFELLIVDDNSTDDSIGFLSGYLQENKIGSSCRLIKGKFPKRFDNQSSGNADNILFREAHGDVFIHLDDDGVIDKRLIEFVKSNIYDDVAVFGEIVFIDKLTFQFLMRDKRIERCGLEIDQECMFKLPSRFLAEWGPLWTCRTETLRKTGGHSLQTAFYRGNDARLGFRIRQLVPTYFATRKPMRFYHFGLPFKSTSPELAKPITRIGNPRGRPYPIEENGGLSFWSSGLLDGKYEEVYSNA